MGHDLGVGLGDEAVARGLKPLLQGQVVLDDAVVGDHDLPGRVLVRVGVLLGGPAVGGPSRVADAVLTGDGRGLEAASRAASLPAARRRSSTPSLHDRHPGRVVAPVLQPAQALDDDGHGVAPADVADDAAHASASRPSFGRGESFAQPGFTTCRARPRARASAGTSCVMVLPAATKAPSPTVTGATRVTSLPTKAAAPMRVRCLLPPS